MEIITIFIVLAIIFIPIFFAKRNNESGLKPFEFSNPYSAPSPQLSEMSNERAITLLIFAWTVPAFIFFIIDYLRIHGGYEYDYEFFRPVYLLVGGISNLILLWVCFSVRLSKWRGAIIFLTLFKVFIYIYWNFFE